MVVVLKKLLKSIPHSYSQVFFIENIWTGLLIIIGLTVFDWKGSVISIICTIASLAFAYLIDHRKLETIEKGIYGYNAVIVGIAIRFYYGISLKSALVGIAVSILSCIILLILEKWIRPLTAPFVFATWSFMMLNSKMHILKYVSHSDSNKNQYYFSIFRGLGQVLFQGKYLVGCMFLLGFIFANKRYSIYALYGSAIGLTIGVILQASNVSISSGLYGYNAVLAAMAFSGFTRKDLVFATMNIIVSTLLFYFISKTNIILLTSPFVFATWIFLILKKDFRVKKFA